MHTHTHTDTHLTRCACVCAHPELVLYLLESAKQLLGVAVDGDEGSGVVVNHGGEYRLRPLVALVHSSELIRDADEALQLSVVPHTQLLTHRPELHTALPACTHTHTHTSL